MSARKRRRTSPPAGQFDLVVVGCGGGHDETNLSGYLCKPRDQPWDAGILGLEAGSGYGALKRLLGTTHPHLFSSLFPKSKSKSLSPTDKAYTVYSHLTAFLLTHAHLDHAASLVISAGSLPGQTKTILGAQGVLDDLNRCIFTPGRCWPNIVGWDGNTSGGKLRALPVADARTAGGRDEARTVGSKDEARTVLGSKDEARTADRDEEYADLGVGMDRVRVRTVPLAHGGSCAGPSHVNGAKHEHGDDAGIYRSSAFFIQHTPTQHEFLFFGDVEADPDPDPVPIPLTPLPSSHPSPTPTLTPASTLDTLPISTLDTLPTSPQCTRPLLHPIWQHTAHLFTSSHLHTILLECSWPAGHPTARLFGHLGVEQVRKEMRALATEVVKARRRQNLESVKPEITPIPDLKPPLTRSTRRTPITSPPPITRGLKRKATHLTPIPPPPSTDPLSGALKGLRVIVIHCKEPPPGFDLQNAPSIADYIVRQLTKGVPELGIGPNELGVEYVAAHQGDEFGESLFLCVALVPVGMFW